MQIKKIISDIFLRNNLIIENCLVTVTKVDLTSDLRFAKIFISIFTKPDKISDKIFIKIKSETKNIKYLMGNKLNSKYVPNISFELDNEYKIYDNINKLIKNG